MKNATWPILFIGIWCISLAAVFVKLADAPPIATGFYRLLFAAFSAVPILFFLQKRRLPTEPGPPFFSLKFWEFRRFAVFGGLIFGINLAIWNTAIVVGNATMATLLNNLAPIWTGIFAALFFAEKPTRNFWLGLAIALLGTVIAYWPKLAAASLDLSSTMGLFGSFFYAFYVIFQKKARNGHLSPLEMLFWVSASGAVFLGILSLILGTQLTGFTAETWLIFVAIALISSLVGWTFIGFSIGKLPVQVTSVALLNQAVFTGILDWLVFGVSLTGWQLAGGAVILAGLVLVVKK